MGKKRSTVTALPTAAPVVVSTMDDPESLHDDHGPAPVLYAEDVYELLDLLASDNHPMSCNCGGCRVGERLRRWSRDHHEVRAGLSG